jgi:OmcA/MtrC family decaheme c-type cytochrome
VSFKVTATNNNGQAVDIDAALKTLRSGSTTDLNNLRMTLAQLQPGQTFVTTTKDPDQWKNYYGAVSATGRAKLASLSGPVSGVYTYTFPAAALDNTLTTRAGIQISGIPAYLFTSDLRTQSTVFVNATGDLTPAGTVSKEAVAIAGCQQCHDSKDSIAHGSRYDPKYCVTCHNPSLETVSATTYPNTNLVTLVHKVHTSQSFDINDLDNAANGIQDFTEVTYPQNIKNCTTCHAAGASNASNWYLRPSIEACGSCHTDVNFATGVGHGPGNIGGAQANNSLCALCHNEANSSIVAAHADNTATPNNVPAGLDNIAYFIDNVTMDASRNPVVTFRVTKNGTAVTFNTFSGSTDAEKLAFVNSGLITGYTGSPSFLVAFAVSQDGVNPPADYNNVGNGKTNGQPASVSIAELRTGDAGTMTGPDGGGFYTATLTQQVSRNSTTGVITSTYPASYPAGAILRAVVLQGRISQTVGGVAVRRYAQSVVAKEATATARRTVVDMSGCLTCHKELALHGGNRVNDPQVCVVCHNPNLAGKRTTMPAANSFNFKDMIHGIHAGSASYQFGTELPTYPGNLKHCTKCHIGTTYRANLPDGVLLSSVSATGTASASTDNVVSPTVGACGRCHNSSTAADHFRLGGGDVNSTRAEAAVTAPTFTLAVDELPTP